MTPNNFIYTDLSTYHPEAAMDFYGQVFNWNFENSEGDYWVAKRNGFEVAGLYEMPEKFQKIKMPSFWMSYILVTDVVKKVSLAKELGGMVEFVDLDQPIGKVALIRDPLGAGYTIYEGSYLNARTTNTPGTLVWNELYVSKAPTVLKFYDQLFDWRIEMGSNNRYGIYNGNGEHISAIQEIPNALKGKHEYWAVYFGVQEKAKTKAKILQLGGSCLYEDPYGSLFTDPFGAMFHVAQIG